MGTDNEVYEHSNAERTIPLSKKPLCCNCYIRVKIYYNIKNIHLSTHNVQLYNLQKPKKIWI